MSNLVFGVTIGVTLFRDLIPPCFCLSSVRTRWIHTGEMLRTRANRWYLFSKCRRRTMGAGWSSLPAGHVKPEPRLLGLLLEPETIVESVTDLPTRDGISFVLFHES